MYCKYLRTSSIGTYNSCPFQYYLLYVVNIPVPSGQKALFGTICHWVWEVLAKAKKNSQITGVLPYGKRIDYNWLLEVSWNRYTRENPQYQYTKADKEFCRKQIQWVFESKFNPLNYYIVGTEKQFQIEIRKQGFEYNLVNPITGKHELGYMELKGTADLFYKENESSNILGVQDYKTGKSTDFITGEQKTYDTLKKDKQPHIYNVAGTVMYPNNKDKSFTMIYTQDKLPITIEFEQKDFLNTIEFLRNTFQKISSDNKPTRLIDDKEKKSEHWKCKYVCAFGKMVIDYINCDGNIITKEFKDVRATVIPDEIIEDGVVYVKINPTKDKETTCDRYFQILKENGVDKAAKIIHNLTVKGKDISLSKRNDYSNPKITKGVIN